MAAIAPSKPGSLGHAGRVWKWAAVSTTTSDTCTPIAIQGAKDITIFAEGTWGTGPDLALHASPQIDATAAAAIYAPCKDLADSVIALGADGHSTVAQLGEYYKPVLTDTGSDTTVDIYILARY